MAAAASSLIAVAHTVSASATKRSCAILISRRLNRNRRLATDFEHTIRSATAFLYAASVMLLIRRLARQA